MDAAEKLHHIRAGLVALDYVPGELDRTAPARIWLQIDTSGDNSERQEPWPGEEGVTWQDESVGGLEIQYVRADLVSPPSAPVGPHTYASTQATKCAGCGEHKHTPLRIDAMGGYVCLTCIDQKLGSLLGEFGYAPSAPVGVEAMPGIRRELVGIVRRDDGEPVWIEPNEATAILRALAGQQPAAVDEVRIPRALAGRVMTALGKFTSDESWSMVDMETADDFGAALAAQQGGSTDG